MRKHGHRYVHGCADLKGQPSAFEATHRRIQPGGGVRKTSSELHAYNEHVHDGACLVSVWARSLVYIFFYL